MPTALAPALVALLALAADGGTPAEPKPAADKDILAPLTKPSISGGLTKEEFTKVLNRHQNEIRSCYDQALRIKPKLEGRVAVKFIVTGQGDVVNPEVITSDTINDENLKACMANVVRSWKFPEPKGGGNVTVTYPWSFKPG
jgi:TonB family protein